MKKIFSFLFVVLFLIFSIVPSVSNAEISIPSNARPVEDLCQEISDFADYVKHKYGDREVGMQVSRKYGNKPVLIVGRFKAIERGEMKLSSLDKAYSYSAYIAPSSDNKALLSNYKADKGDIILVKGILYKGLNYAEIGVLLGLNDFASLFGGGGMFQIQATGTSFTNLTKGESEGGGFWSVLFGAGGVVALVGVGYFFYKKRYGGDLPKFNSQDIKDKTMCFANKIKDNVNIDDVKVKAEEVKQKANDQVNKLKNITKK